MVDDVSIPVPQLPNLLAESKRSRPSITSRSRRTGTPATATCIPQSSSTLRMLIHRGVRSPLSTKSSELPCGWVGQSLASTALVC